MSYQYIAPSPSPARGEGEGAHFMVVTGKEMLARSNHLLPNLLKRLKV